MSIRSSAFSAARWTTVAALLRALLQIVQTIVLARLLVPADFGLMAIAGAAYAIVAIFVDLGLSGSLMHFSKPSRSVLSTLYWVNLGAAIVLMLFFLALAWPLARIYAEPALFPLLSVMSLALPLGALGYQFRVMAEKALHFSTLAVIEVAAALGGFAVAIVTALVEGGPYALVAAQLAAAGIASGLAWLLLSQGIRPGFQLRLADAFPYLRYGSYRLGATLLNSLRLQVDVLLGGAIAGASAMGAYTVPRDLSLRLANTVVNPVVTRIGLPLMAKVQGDIAALRSIYLQSLRMTASVNFPLYVVLAVWAEDVVAILLGPQWQEAGFFMRLFAVWGLIRSVSNPLGSLLYATGYARRVFWWSLSQLLIQPLFLLLGAKLGGLHGLAWAMLVTNALVFYFAFRFFVRPACGASFSEYMAQLSPPLIASLGAVGLGFLVSQLMPGMWLRLGVGIGTSGLVYLGLSYLLNRQWILSMIELARPLFRFKV